MTPVRSIVWRALWRPALIGLALGGLLSSYWAFKDAMAPAPPRAARYEAAVVFTGAFERLHAGVKLLETGRTARLYISGANPNAGIRPAHFLADFGEKHPRLAHFLNCCVEFGERADSTIENALETRCWLRANAIRGPILLVTSAMHMPRAMAAARGAIDDVEIEPLVVADGYSPPEAALRGEIIEYLKYLVTRALSLTPALMRRAVGADWSC